MTKLIPFLLLIVSCGQGNDQDKQEAYRQHYQSEFTRNIDSAIVYVFKSSCAIDCKRLDSAEYYKRISDSFSKVSNRNYDLLYPNGNPADTKPSQPKCDCK